ncbi:kinase-like domain-containing protein [Aspergillus granulosus]|uniref:Kinase-like domain-containing protein n=1 Tax=Aspergillus granulosus TaxID=176169 RepID=A0ABR4HYN8_9EURO
MDEPIRIAKDAGGSSRSQANPNRRQGPRGPGSHIVSRLHKKTPSLLSFANKDLENQILREVEACEILRKNPHPNIATYYGYQETNGRISGLCFKRYASTLLEAVNPGYWNKVAFRASARELVTEAMKRNLQGILAAIKHLHSLGLVHNDINPANVMIDKDGTFILIDFGSCRSIGEPLGTAGRTHHWYDDSVEVSLEKNDLDAFKELQTWLTGSVDEDFLLSELHAAPVDKPAPIIAIDSNPIRSNRIIT